MRRIMIAGTRSGCGKTTVTCALLESLKNRGLHISAFKCGPDYIDPMFHKTVIGADAYNLDSFLMDSNTVNYLLRRNSADISVIEGVMGFYDGIAFSEQASSYEISEITDTPVILVADAKGASLSVSALLTGFKNFRNNKICCVIFNNTNAMTYPYLKRECEKLGIEPLGFMPQVKDAHIDSRHLGLVTAAEIGDIKTKIQLLAEAAEQSINIDRIVELSECGDTKACAPPVKRVADVKIAVAYDRAFCFYYEDNFRLLREMGAVIVYFSPLKNEPVPECDGLILGGGYPELYADILEKNTVTLNSVRKKIELGVPCIAECGGFMYLHEVMEDNAGTEHTMAGVIKGACRKKDRLVRFGYMEMTAERDNILCKKGHKIRAREFHYFDSDNCGDGFTARKNESSWRCVHTENNLFAGFAHLHFYSDVSLAENFIHRCEEYRCTERQS